MMTKKTLSTALSTIILIVAANSFAQDYYLLADQKEDFSKFRQNKTLLNEFPFISDSTVNKSGEQALNDSIVVFRKHSIFAGILSVNYSRMFQGENAIFTVGGGLSFAATAFDAGGVGLMVEATVLKGGIKHFFEPGVLLYADLEVFAPMLRAGYRYQDPGGFLFRAGLLFTYWDGFSLLPALSIGYSF